jgi:hypothetical protein
MISQRKDVDLEFRIFIPLSKTWFSEPVVDPAAGGQSNSAMPWAQSVKCVRFQVSVNTDF